MAVRTTTFNVALLIILIIAVLLIIESCWAIWYTNRSGGDDCPCTGLTDVNINGFRAFQIFLLLFGIFLIVYAVVMYLIPTSQRRKEVSQQVKARFVRKQD